MSDLRRPTVRTDVRTVVLALVIGERRAAEGVAAQLARAGCDVRIAVDEAGAMASVLRLRPAVVFLEPSPGLQVRRLRVAIQEVDGTLEVIVLAGRGRDAHGHLGSELSPISSPALARVLARARRRSPSIT